MKRKRIPYACNRLLDDAVMNLTTASNDLIPLVKRQPVTPEERVSLPASAMIAIHQTLQILSAIRDLVEDQP